jgi:hypothetical protein
LRDEGAMLTALRRKPLFIKTFHPTGKSLRIYGNCVKLKIELNEKYFCFFEVKIAVYYMHPVPPRGAYHDRHERGTGSGGRGWCL